MHLYYIDKELGIVIEVQNKNPDNFIHNIANLLSNINPQPGQPAIRLTNRDIQLINGCIYEGAHADRHRYLIKIPPHAIDATKYTGDPNAIDFLHAIIEPQVIRHYQERQSQPLISSTIIETPAKDQLAQTDLFGYFSYIIYPKPTESGIRDTHTQHRATLKSILKDAYHVGSTWAKTVKQLEQFANDPQNALDDDKKKLLLSVAGELHVAVTTFRINQVHFYEVMHRYSDPEANTQYDKVTDALQQLSAISSNSYFVESVKSGPINLLNAFASNISKMDLSLQDLAKPTLISLTKECQTMINEILLKNIDLNPMDYAETINNLYRKIVLLNTSFTQLDKIREYANDAKTPEDLKHHLIDYKTKLKPPLDISNTSQIEDIARSIQEIQTREPDVTDHMRYALRFAIHLIEDQNVRNSFLMTLAQLDTLSDSIKAKVTSGKYSENDPAILKAKMVLHQLMETLHQISEEDYFKKSPHLRNQEYISIKLKKIENGIEQLNSKMSEDKAFKAWGSKKTSLFERLRQGMLTLGAGGVGALIGGAIGSVVPVVGTLIGAAIGGGIGFIGGIAANTLKSRKDDRVLREKLKEQLQDVLTPKTSAGGRTADIQRRLPPSPGPSPGASPEATASSVEPTPGGTASPEPTQEAAPAPASPTATPPPEKEQAPPQDAEENEPPSPGPGGR